MPRFVLPMLTLSVGLLGAATQVWGAAAQCKAQTPSQTVNTVVELYTSEGCSSCPPADRWLSTLKGRPDVLALAFHVTYWDRLGWPDRFALPEATERQNLLASAARSNSVYTPQVIVNGRDERGAGRLEGKTLALPKAPLTLTRDGDKVTAQLGVAGAAGSGSRLSGYWAVLEDSHQTKVRAGENAGETLRHDHVVRLYKPVSAWAADKSFSTELRVSSGVADNPRRAAFVVVDPISHKPVQAASIALPAPC